MTMASVRRVLPVLQRSVGGNGVMRRHCQDRRVGLSFRHFEIVWVASNVVSNLTFFKSLIKMHFQPKHSP